jgi:hypothetical protein
MKKVALGVVLTSILTLSACVSTKVFSLKDPTYYNRHFRHVLVVGNFAKIEYQQDAEDCIVRELRESWGVMADASYQILPPLRVYSDSEKIAIFQAHGFDCYAIISGKGEGITEVHVPSYTTSSAAVTANGNSATGYGSSTTSGGYTNNVLSSADFDLSLFDFENGHKVCYAQSNSSTSANQGSMGIQWVSEKGLLESSSEHLADEMVKNDLFIRDAK